MNPLFGLYAPSYPMNLGLSDSKARSGRLLVPGDGMVATVLMTTLCATGIAFYIRFLVALALECKSRWICYLVHLRLGSRDLSITEEQESGECSARAA